MSAFSLRPYQREAVDAVDLAYRERGVQRPLIVLPTGCHRAGQRVLMFDGSTKPVEDVSVGDLLMGPDSTSRTVLHLTGGEGAMMEIRPVKGDPWVVNDEHILSLVETQASAAGRYPSERGGTIRDVPLPDWWQWSTWRKHTHKLFRAAVDFPEISAPNLDPHFMGIVLGDGSLSVGGRINVATVDPEISSALAAVAADHGLTIRRDGINDIQHHLRKFKRDGGRGKRNPIVEKLVALGLSPIACADRFVPDVYKLGSRSVRLGVLAGLMDSDGSLSGSGYDFGSKSERLAQDVAFISRSLGLAAYVTKRPSGHYRVSVSGDCSIVPCRVARKIAKPRGQKKDALRTGFQVVPTGTVERFYGFALSGDRRYLLDDFTVTHNSGKTVIFSHVALNRCEDGPVLVIAHREELLTQARDKIMHIAPDLSIGIVKAEQNNHYADVILASIQTIARPKRIAPLVGKVSTVIVDEAHHAAAQTYRDALRALGSYDPNGPLTIGVTATAGRGDKVGLDSVWQEIVYQRGIIHMIAHGYLVDVRALEVMTDLDYRRVTTSRGDYTDASLGSALEDSGAIESAATAYQQYASNRRGVAFTPTIATAHELAQQLNSRGIRAEAVSGETEKGERAAILRRLSSGETQVVCNCQVLTEGFDEPALSCALIARPTKSKTMFTQMAGRVLRPHPTKTDALILNLFAPPEAGLATIADLSGLDPDSVPKIKKGESLAEAVEREDGEKRAFGKHVMSNLTTRELDLFARSNLRWIPSGGGFVLPCPRTSLLLVPDSGAEKYSVFETVRGSQPKAISRDLTLDWAQGVGEEYARAHGGVIAHAKAPWRAKPVSEKQAYILRKKRLPVPATSGEASDAISAYEAAQAMRQLTHTH